PTEDRPFPWRPPEDFGAWAREAARIGAEIGVDPETAGEVPFRYGTGFERVHALIRAEPRLAERIVPDAPFCLAETVHAARREMATTLEDILVRRIPLLRITRPTRTTLLLVAALVGSVLDWTEERREQEVAAVSSGRTTGKGDDART
ncbi:MAG: hypothetical protein HY509_06255, partial [Acidobacteria bacterium]|nr:hypothetical protein [Acidobacteriota bacterium]